MVICCRCYRVFIVATVYQYVPFFLHSWEQRGFQSSGYTSESTLMGWASLQMSTLSGPLGPKVLLFQPPATARDASILSSTSMASQFSSSGGLGEDPLPVPTTSRNLRPRSQGRASVARTSRSPRTVSPEPVIVNVDKGKGKMREIGESSDYRPTKKIKLSPEKGKGKMIDVEIVDSEEEVDQLTMSQKEHEHDAGVGGDSDSWAGPSTEIYDLCSHEATSPIVSSPSLAKLLHPRNQSPSPPHVHHKRKRPSGPQPQPPPLDPSSLLTAYTCPICFSSPTNATLTPCGHIMCGSCLFAAVKAGLQRHATMMVGEGQPLYVSSLHLSKSLYVNHFEMQMPCLSGTHSWLGWPRRGCYRVEGPRNYKYVKFVLDDQTDAQHGWWYIPRFRRLIPLNGRRICAKNIVVPSTRLR